MLLLADLFLHNAHLVLSSQVNVDGPDMVIPLSMHAKSVKADVSPTHDGIIVASLGLQPPNGVHLEPIAFTKEMRAGGGVFPNDPHALTVVYPPMTVFSKEHALHKEWMPWHEAFGALKDKFKNDAKMYAQGCLTSLACSLRRWRDANGNLRNLSPYMCDMELKQRRVLLLDIEHVPCFEFTEHKILCWHDMISDFATLCMPIYLLVERLEKLYNTIFGLRLEKDKGILGQFAIVREIEHAFKLKHKQLEHEKSKLKKMCHGSSKEMETTFSSWRIKCRVPSDIRHGAFCACLTFISMFTSALNSDVELDMMLGIFGHIITLMMVMANNSDEYVTVGREKYEELYFVHSLVTVGNEGAGVSSGRLEVAFGNLGSSPMEVAAGSSSGNVLPSSDKSLAMYEDFKFVMM
ncbi:hypothetical protein D8674_010386 [Pyrus ussuriensis x Pyrus communis]|uniref:Uncharacterized protein n=1 Tax=Pyrus ussuriensis x Pyrus communis TaxID=2448454 RepID=A0A5N5FAL7_9ROSA|nr:hypothetical protein D8674_010386 [Pyrus ussuriensis x Pyrus communis]